MDTLLSPLLYLVSWIMLGWHWLFAQVVGDDLAWTLSIVGLVIVIRTLLIPLFVRQIKASRKLQLIQPQQRELQKKYGHDRERLTQETMALYKDSGTNPFASCLPILLQAPVFFALFRVIDGVAVNVPRGAFADHPQLFESAKAANFFGIPGIELIDTFIRADSVLVKVTAILMVAIMTVTTFLTQRQLMRKNMPAAALTGPYAQQQKILLYVLPLLFAVSGVAFPLGVVLYWCVSNIWTMCQQFYVIRRMPAPGSPAEEAMRKRTEARGVRRGRLHRRRGTDDGSGPDTDGSSGGVATATGAPPSGRQGSGRTGPAAGQGGSGAAGAGAGGSGGRGSGSARAGGASAARSGAPPRQQPRKSSRADRKRRAT